MKTVLTLIFFAIGITLGYSQNLNKSLEDNVKVFVLDSTSNNYWKNVYAKLVKSEGRINSEECMLFYYSNGVKSIKSKPFPSLSLNMDRQKMFNYANSGKLKKAKELGLELIKKNPFDIGTLIYLSMAIDKLENNTSNEYYQRMKCIVDSIFGAGDGKTPETAYKISEMGDDEILIGFTGFRGKKLGTQNIQDKTFSVWENHLGEKLYFEYLFIFF